MGRGGQQMPRGGRGRFAPPRALVACAPSGSGRGATSRWAVSGATRPSPLLCGRLRRPTGAALSASGSPAGRPIAAPSEGRRLSSRRARSCSAFGLAAVNLSTNAWSCWSWLGPRPACAEAQVPREWQLQWVRCPRRFPQPCKVMDTLSAPNLLPGSLGTQC